MFEIRQVKHEEIDQALSLLLRDNLLDTRPVKARVQSFRELASQEGYDLNRQMVVLCDGDIIYSCLFVPNQGHTAFVFSSCPCQAKPDEISHAVEALNRLRRWAVDQGNNLLEVLLDPADSVREEIFLHSDFKRLTDLIYMSWSAQQPPQLCDHPKNISWLSYGPENHELFKTVIKETYRDSLDCPELEGLRQMEDVVLSHKSAGEFDPGWWKLLLLDDQPLGVLLTAPLRTGDSMELIYMGLSACARGQGLGKVLLREALSCASEFGTHSLILAVDCRNHQAYHLYKSFGFEEVIRRRVLYYSSDWRVAVPDETLRTVENSDKVKSV